MTIYDGLTKLELLQECHNCGERVLRDYKYNHGDEYFVKGCQEFMDLVQRSQFKRYLKCWTLEERTLARTLSWKIISLTEEINEILEENISDHSDEDTR